jgi:N-carbamoylputrescine amidase
VKKQCASAKRSLLQLKPIFFEGCPGRHVADTPLGRIGVSICYEGFLASTIRSLHEENADFVLMPHSAPTPTLNTWLRKKDLNDFEEALRTTSSAVASALGVPTVMANKVGPWKTRPPFPFSAEDSAFPGLSAIAGADGAVLASLGNHEGVVVADITLNPDNKVKNLPPLPGKWARPVPSFFKLFAIAEMLGHLRYVLSSKRRRMARKVSDGDNS